MGFLTWSVNNLVLTAALPSASKIVYGNISDSLWIFKSILEIPWQIKEIIVAAVR